MNKILLILIGVVVAVGIVGVLIFGAILKNANTQTPPTSNTDTGVGGIDNPSSVSVGGSNTGTGTGTTFTLTGFDGSSIPAKDIKKDPALVTDPFNEGYYYLGYHYDRSIASTSPANHIPYMIGYIDSTQYFNISLLEEPIGQARLDAEQYLMQHLGISPAQMCKLSYMVSVPYSVNKSFSGQNLGFSFCPGAAAF